MRFNGTEISIKDIWIEHEVYTERSILNPPQIDFSERDYLNFTVNLSSPLFETTPHPFFICDEGDFDGGAMMTSYEGNHLFSVVLLPGAITQHRTTLRLVNSFHDSNPLMIKLSWHD